MAFFDSLMASLIQSWSAPRDMSASPAGEGASNGADSKSEKRSGEEAFPDTNDNIVEFKPPSGITSRVDAALACLQSCASSRAGSDAVLVFLFYLFRLGGNVLDTLGHAALSKTHLPFASPGRIRPPPPSWSRALGTSLLRLEKRCTAVVAMIGDVRAFGRLWGLLGIYFSAKKLLSPEREEATGGRSWSSRLDTAIAASQILLLASFHGTDNLVHLTSRKVLRFSPPTLKTLSRLCMRSWALYIFIDVARLLLDRRRRILSNDEERLLGEDSAWKAQWRKNLLRSLAWTPIAVHRSIDSSLLNDTTISLLGLYPAASKMKDLWLSKSESKAT